MSSLLLPFKKQQQAQLQKLYPATIKIGTTTYKGALVNQEGETLTQEGGVKATRELHFSVLQTVLPLAVVRNISLGSQPLLRVSIEHVETGLTYRLTDEQTDLHGVVRVLKGIQGSD